MVEFQEMAASNDNTVGIRLYGQGVDMPLAVDQTSADFGVIWTLTDHQGTVRDLASRYADDTFRLEHITYTHFGVPTPSGGLAEETKVSGTNGTVGHFGRPRRGD